MKDGVVFISGKSSTGKPFSTPEVTVKQGDKLYSKDSCLEKQENVMVGGIARIQQTEGCSYAGATVATFFTQGTGYLVLAWTTDVEDQFTTYEQILSTFTFTK